MNTHNTYSVVVLIAFAILFVMYISRGTPQTATRSSEQQSQVAELKKQIAGLQERVNWLEERLTEPQRQKASQF